MRHLRTYEGSNPLDMRPASVTETEKLAIGAIESYIKQLFFENIKEFAFVQHDIDWTNIYFRIEFHSVTIEVVEILKELTSFFNIPFGLEHGEQRIIQYVIIDKPQLSKYADKLEAYATAKKYNM